MNRQIILVALIVLLTSCASNSNPQRSSRTYMGHPVSDVSMPIAGGKVITVPVTEAGPIPAENKFFKVEVAGIIIKPLLPGSDIAELIWVFTVSARKGVQLEQVYVDRVFPDNEGVRVVSDEQALLENFEGGKVWSGQAKPAVLRESSVPWMYENRGSVFVFKVTLKARGHEPYVLYQPSWISTEMKASFLSGQ